ncbi:hypothetical protein ACYZT4_12590 [Pseudomonas sp. GB2N2]
MERLLLSGAEQHQQEVDNADPGLESGLESLQYPVRRSAVDGLIEIPFTQNQGHPLGRVVLMLLGDAYLTRL